MPRRAHFHKNLTNTCTRLLSQYVPGAFYWTRLPAFTGWLALMAGMIGAHLLLNRAIIPCSSSLYNGIVAGAIIFITFAVIYFKNMLLRNSFFVILGVLIYIWHTNQNSKFFTGLDAILDGNTNSVCITGKIVSPPLQTDRATEFLIAAEYISTPADTLCLHGAVFKCTGFETPPSHGTVTAAGTLRLPRQPSNPYMFDEYTYSVSNGVHGTLYCDKLTILPQQESLRERCEDYLRGTVLQAISLVVSVPLRGVLQAVFLGEKNDLSPEILETFRRAGIYHLLALSGLHVGILVGSMLLFLSIFPLSKTIKIGMTICGIWGYLLFVGFMPSLFRAVVMATLLLLSSVVQRNNHALNTLGVAGIIWLCISPISVFTPGFQLSFSATFGIIALHPVLIQQGIPVTHQPHIDFFLRLILTVFYVSLAGFIATAPVLVHHFGTISLFGLFANLFAVSLMGITMNTFFIGILTCPVSRFLSLICMRATEFFLSGIVAIADLSMRFPWATISMRTPYVEWVILYCLFFCALVCVARKYRRFFLVRAFPVLFFSMPMIILLHLHCLPRRTEVTFFNTRSGAMTGIRFPNRDIWLLYAPDRNTPSRTYGSIVSAWLRHHPFHTFRAVIMPKITQNSIHDLWPLFDNSPPKNIILCSVQPEGIFQDDFSAFLEEYTCSSIDAADGLTLFPAPHCTCVVYPDNQDKKWYEPVSPASIIMSLNGFRIYYRVPDSLVAPGNTGISFMTDSTLQVSSAPHGCENTEIPLAANRWPLHERGALHIGIDRSRKFPVIKY